MADNEFQSRQERNERIKNIEYQVEEENSAVVTRREKEKKRLERTRRQEQQKAERQKEERENRRNEEERKRKEKKKEQNEAREIMAEKRKNKKGTQQKGKQSRGHQGEFSVRKNTDNATSYSGRQGIDLAAAPGLANELARENVRSDIYVNGKQVAEDDGSSTVYSDGQLPSELVEKIRREQEKTVRKTEEDIRNSSRESLTDKERIMQNTDENIVAQNKLNSGAGKYTMLSGTRGAFGGSPIDASVQNRNVNMAGNYGAAGDERTQNESSGYSSDNNSGRQNAGNPQNNGATPTETANNGIQNEADMPQSGELGNREDIRERLTRLNNERNNPNGIFMGPEEGPAPYNNINNSSNNNSDGLGAALGAAALGAAASGDGAGATRPLNRAARRGGGGTAGRVQSQEGQDEDLDSQATNNALNTMGKAANMAGSMGKTVSTAAKMAKTAMAAKKFLAFGPLLAGGGILGVILLALIGGISFITNMPGMVRDTFADTWDNFWQESKGVFDNTGETSKSEADRARETTEIKNLAEYLEDMGYDLEYNGFATKVVKDKDGKIDDIQSKYLPAYIASEQRTYMIGSENADMNLLWQDHKYLYEDEADRKSELGTGMIMLEKTTLETALGTGLSELITQLTNVGDALFSFFLGDTGERGTQVKNLAGLTNRISIKRDTKEMFISNVDIVDAWNTGGYDVYRFSLKEWVEKYSLPTELCLTLHLATRAPEFAYNFATSYDTKVYIGAKELSDVQIDLVYVKTDGAGNVILDEKKQPVMAPISELSDEEIKSKGISQEALTEMRKINTKVTAFTPYITKVMNHWYYQQVIYEGVYKENDDDTNPQDVNVYEIRSLAEGDDGYLRYYAYTRRDNADAEHIEEDTKKEEPIGDSIFMTLIDVAIKAMKAYFTGGYSGISGIMAAATDVAMEEAYKQLSDAVIDQISDQVMGMLPDQLAGMLNVRDFLKGNLSFESLEKLAETGINLDNMTSFVDFDKIANQLSLDNIKMNVDDLWKELNLQEELMNMDIAGLGSVNDLKDVVQDIDIANLDSVIENKFTEITDLAGTNIDKLTNELVGGFSSSISSIQDSIVSSCDTLFSGLSEADFNKISDRLLGDVTDQIAAITSAPIMEQLQGSIKGIVDKQFDAEVLAGLQNEFSKQLTGLSYEDLSKIAEIKDMDFNQLKDLSGQVTGITSALEGAETSITNLSAQVNRLSKDITGMDTKVLEAISDSVTKVDTTVDTLSTQAGETLAVVKGIDTSKPEAKELVEKANTINEKTSEMKKAVNNLEFEKVEQLQSDINGCRSDINRIINTAEALDDKTIGRVQTQMSKLESEVTNVIDTVTSIDMERIENLKYRIADFDKTGLVDLANTLSDLDVSSAGMQKLVTQYGTDITNLRASEIGMIMDAINGQNISAQRAMDKITGYLMRVDETELTDNLLKLNSTVNLLKDATENLDAEKVIRLANKVPGLDSLHLNNIASQISKLENVTVDKLLQQVEEVPKKIVNQVTNKLATKITDGVTEQITNNLGGKLKGNLLNTGNFKSGLKNAMTGGEKQDIDTQTEDQAIEAPSMEYSTGFYVREIRRADYFQIAEPMRVLYSPRHWIKMFREDKYVTLDSEAIDRSKVDDQEYIEKYGKTIWEATNGDIESAIYAMLQGIQSAESQYLLRYFKELFNDFGYIFDGNYGFATKVDPTDINKNTIGWIFKTAEYEEPVYSGEMVEHSVITKEVSEEVANDSKALDSIAKQSMPSDATYYEYNVTRELEDVVYDVESDQDAIDLSQSGAQLVKYTLEITYYKYENRTYQTVRKAEYEPYTWSASRIGILTPKAQDAVYGFEPGLDIVSPVDGIVVAKTEATTNEMGQNVAQSVTIELKDTGDGNADGMRIILIGGDYSGLMVGSIVKKVDYNVDKEGKYTGATEQSVIGKTTNETIKIMVLDKDQTPVDDVSDYIYPPYEEYIAKKGDSDNERE